MRDRLSDQLRCYAGLVESLASSLSRRDRNELDDLIQEGMIACWELLVAGSDPAARPEEIEKRMKKWLRYRGRQKRDVPVSYDKLLKMGAKEELHEANAEVASVSARTFARRVVRVDEGDAV